MLAVTLALNFAIPDTKNKNGNNEGEINSYLFILVLFFIAEHYLFVFSSLSVPPPGVVCIILPK